MREVRISPDDDGIRLDRWFHRHHPSVGHGPLQSMLRRKLVKLDGARAEAATRIHTGQVLRLPPLPEEPAVAPRAAAPALASMLLAEDDELLVLDKPAGLPVQGGSKIDHSLLDLLPTGAHPVHRLDRDTSGVLVVAKTPAAASALAARFREREVEKHYLALVLGQPEPAKGTIDQPLAVGSTLRKTRVLHEGAAAVTHYATLAQDARSAWLALRPETGRKHQLRCHLAWLGHPIVGDGKYGGRMAHALQPQRGGQLHLHCRRLRFTHAGRVHDHTAAPPDHMRDAPPS